MSRHAFTCSQNVLVPCLVPTLLCCRLVLESRTVLCRATGSLFLFFLSKIALCACPTSVCVCRFLCDTPSLCLLYCLYSLPASQGPSPTRNHTSSHVACVVESFLPALGVFAPWLAPAHHCLFIFFLASFFFLSLLSAALTSPLSLFLYASLSSDWHSLRGRCSVILPYPSCVQGSLVLGHGLHTVDAVLRLLSCCMQASLVLA